MHSIKKHKTPTTTLSAGFEPAVSSIKQLLDRTATGIDSLRVREAYVHRYDRTALYRLLTLKYFRTLFRITCSKHVCCFVDLLKWNLRRI